MFSKQTIDTICGAEGFGAGNYFYYLEQYHEYPDQPVILLDDPCYLEGRSLDALSCNDIFAYANRLAQWYRAQGVEPKDPVALIFEDSVYYLLHYMALNSIGAIPVFINGGLSLSIVAQFCRNVGVKMVMTNRGMHLPLTEQFMQYAYPVVIHDKACIDVSRFDGKLERYQHQDEDPVLLGHTSGTTGIPKAVQFNHKRFSYGVIRQIHKQFGERFLNALPHSHASGMSMMMSYLIRGATIKMQTQKSPQAIFNAVAEFRPDIFASFPKIYVEMCRFDFADYDLSSIGAWLSTGDANHESHIKKLMSQGGYTYKGKTYKGSIFIDNLGSSEVGFAAFRNIYKPGDTQFNRRIGQPFDWVDVAILSPEGKKLGANEVGLLGVAAASITPGYWNNTLLSEKNRLGGYWLTGDYAYRDENGIYFHVDRTTDSIATPEGVLYSCQAEELVLKVCPEIFDCSIVKVVDDQGRNQAVIEVELRDNQTETGLLERINQALAEKQQPAISRLITGSSNRDIGVTGKALKRVIRERLAAA